MREQTQKKLTILVQANKINFADLAFLNKLDKDLAKFDGGSKEEMLLIHVAMSLFRKRNNQEIDKIPDELWKQIISKPVYQQAKEYWQTNEKNSPILLGKNESQYIIMHLVNVMTKEVNDHEKNRCRRPNGKRGN